MDSSREVLASFRAFSAVVRLACRVSFSAAMVSHSSRLAARSAVRVSTWFFRPAREKSRATTRITATSRQTHMRMSSTGFLLAVLVMGKPPLMFF